MQTSLCDKPQAPQKVKNILIRHSCSKRVQANNRYQHPEASYILKYSPKYYKDLTLQTTCQSPLLSKVKKIKRLKRFTGYFDRNLPQKLWFNLLGNTRKEIEEFPQISSNKRNLHPGLPFWERLNQQKLRHFWNVTRVLLPTRRVSNMIHDFDNFLTSKERFMKHIGCLRKLKSLQIRVRDDTYQNVKWVMGKLNGMGGFLNRLETLGLDVVVCMTNIQELFRNKTFFSYLTSLKLSLDFDPLFAEIPLMSKKLNSFSLNFQGRIADGKPEFRTLLTSMQQLTQLKSFRFNWAGEGKDFWSYFKPQPSLEHLMLAFNSYDFMNAGLFEEDNLKNIVAHWEEIKELKTLEFNFSCQYMKEYNLMKKLITNVLKKVQKLKTLKFWVGTSVAESGSQTVYEPFLVEDLSHLYKTLERFEFQFSSWMEDRFAKFDLRVLEPFKNLKSVKIDGKIELSENIEVIVSLLEGNQRDGEYPLLEFNLKRSIGSPAEWLGNTLKALERTKRADKNLKIIIDLTFGLKEGYLEVLEGLCSGVQSGKTIKNLRLGLSFKEGHDYSHFRIDKVGELLDRYPGMRNLSVVLSNRTETLEFIKVDGEKEQLFGDPYSYNPF